MGLLKKILGKDKDGGSASGAATEPDTSWYMIYEVSDQELDRWSEEALWGITAFVREEIDNAQSRDRTTMLLVFTADGCDGCAQLMTQLHDERYMFEESVHLVKASVGDFPARWFKHVQMGDTIIHLPGLPTAFLCALPESGSEELTVTALSLGPLDNANATHDLTERLLQGESRFIADARDAVIAIDQAGSRTEYSPGGNFRIHLHVTLTSEGSPESISPVM